jgi:F-type H+-transporting ATPase subunit b
MELLTPGTGLLIWQAIIFGILFFLLAKLAWPVILESLKIREESIQEALDSAEKAKLDMSKMQAENLKLLEEARKERDVILKDARDVASALQVVAKEDAAKQTEKMIADAKTAINTEKQAAMTEVKTLVAQLSLQITEKILRKSLDGDKAQKELINEFVKDLNLN